MVVAGVHIAVSEPLVKKVRFSIWFRTWGHGVWFVLVLSLKNSYGHYVLYKMSESSPH